MQKFEALFSYAPQVHRSQFPRSLLVQRSLCARKSVEQNECRTSNGRAQRQSTCNSYFPQTHLLFSSNKSLISLISSCFIQTHLFFSSNSSYLFPKFISSFPQTLLFSANILCQAVKRATFSIHLIYLVYRASFRLTYIKFACFFDIFSGFVWWFGKKFLPLHPLSRTKHSEL